MKVNLTKGPTISPAIFPVPSPITGEVEVVGFSGMSEIDYVTTHLMQGILSRVPLQDITHDDVLSTIKLALLILAETNQLNQQGPTNNRPRE